MGNDVIQKVRYSHDAIIDMIIAAPMISQGEIARFFGYTETWVSLVMSSNAFQARLAARREELVDPDIIASIETNLRAIAQEAGRIVHTELVQRRNPNYALRALEKAGTLLGLGAKADVEVNNTTNVVVVPAKSGSSAEWMERFAPSPDGEPMGKIPPARAHTTIDAETGEILSQ